MRDKSDKLPERPNAKKHLIRRVRSRSQQVAVKEKPARARGYDPELLYVECGRCGAPVLWETGRATDLLNHAGIDPLEIDASCLLVTDACPACGATEEYSVRICRVSDRHPAELPPTHGHA